MPARPNILFIMTDQQTAGAMSCAGHGDLRTPGMDRIATRGVRFDRAYCTFPLCTPSRFSLMTGRWPHEVGCAGNSVNVPPGMIPQSMGALLSAAGYECGYAGKWHVGPGAVSEGWGFERVHGFNDVGLDDAAIGFLQRKRDRPFLLVTSFDNPHNICEWARQQALPHGEVPDAPTEACPQLPANFAVAPFSPLALERERAANEQVHPTLTVADDWWRHYRQAYFRLIEKVDAQIGRILNALRDADRDKDTLILFTSDHGDGNAAHHWNQKSALYEEAVRVPMIVSPPGGGAPRTDHSHLVSNGLDILPTFCDYAGITPPTGLSLRPLLEGASNTWRDSLTVQTCFAPPRYLSTVGRMIVTRCHKYAVYSWGQHREQLFELSQDPGEMVNLAVEPRHAALLKDHRQQLRTWAQTAGDELGALIVP
ncbi:MAG: sulfatase-like hydrolase/transferase [Planctomycetes bacterium]|nr:sulfatase-like hydrolase/transferase [Planctomycetota bacterium]